MKKLFVLIVALCLAVGWLVSDSFARSRATRHNALEIERTVGDDQNVVDTLRAVSVAGNTNFRVLPNGGIVIYDGSGDTAYYVEHNGRVNYHNIIYIDGTDDLSTWIGNESGESHFVMEAGKEYVVDLWAIATHGCAPGGVTAMGTSGANVAFSGVTGVLEPVTIDNDGMTVTVRLGLSPNTTAARAKWSVSGGSGFGIPGVGEENTFYSGATAIYVYPPPGSATTIYGFQVLEGNDNTNSAITDYQTALVYVSGWTPGIYDNTGAEACKSGLTVARTFGSSGITLFGAKQTYRAQYNSGISWMLIDGRGLPGQNQD